MSRKKPASSGSSKKQAGDFAVLTPQDFDRLLKSGVSGAYFFFGEEEYLARIYADRLREAVTGGDDNVFNRAVLDADTYSPAALSDEILTLPMLAGRRFIEVRGVDFSRGEAAEELCEVLGEQNDSPHAVVLIYALGESFNAGDERRPSKALAQISELASAVRFARQSPARLAGWAARHFAAWGAEAPAEVCLKLVDYSGRSMTTLSSEIKKLAGYVLAHKRAVVTHDDIRLVCTANIEHDSFALANAILRGDADGAMETLTYAFARREMPELLLASITRVFCDLYAVKTCADAGMDKRAISSALKMHEYKAGLYISACRSQNADRLAQAVERCRAADLKLKSTPLPGEIILARLAVSRI